MSNPDVLPTTPGTVIAIGGWWLILLPPFHQGELEYPSRVWELLPPESNDVLASMRRAGVKSQCVYDEDWVRAEVEQHGGYDLVALPINDLEEL